MSANLDQDLINRIIKDDGGDDTPLMAEFRKTVKDLHKELKSRDAELTEIRGTQRKQTVAQILEGKGLSPSIAKFIPADVAAEDEAVTAWLKEEGEVFGFKEKPADPAPVATDVDPNASAAQSSIASAPPAVQAWFAQVAAAEAGAENLAVSGMAARLEAAQSAKGKGAEAMLAALNGE